MLKIKDNVDLQILVDEFKFERIGETYLIVGTYDCNPTYAVSVDEERMIKIEHQTSNEVYDSEKEEIIYISYKNNEIYDLIHDLIKADLVEKVGE